MLKEGKRSISNGEEKVWHSAFSGNGSDPGEPGQLKQHVKLMMQQNQQFNQCITDSEESAQAAPPPRSPLKRKQLDEKKTGQQFNDIVRSSVSTEGDYKLDKDKIGDNSIEFVRDTA